MIYSDFKGLKLSRLGMGNMRLPSLDPESRDSKINYEEAHKMIDAARALGMDVMLGCMTETSCGTSAAAQLSPVVDFADLDGNLLIANDRFDGVKVVDGRLTLPEKPGIGVTLL